MQFVPTIKKRMHTLYALVCASGPRDGVTRQLQSLSDDCHQYIQSRGRLEPRDELNDESEKTGQLRECIISQVWPRSAADRTESESRCLGLAIETRYQKATYRIILLARRGLSSEESPLTAIFYKASQNNLKHIKNWLDFKFTLPSALPLQFPPELLPRLCSSYLTVLAEHFATGTDHTDALRQATLKQTVGNLRLTMAFSGATGPEIAPKLKTLDLDLPSETTSLLLEKARQRSTVRGTAQTAFLDELSHAIADRTGLRLPFTSASSFEVGQLNRNSMAGTGAGRDPENLITPTEPPLKVTKITCAAFAISIDGKLKFASKPIENAEVVGYREEVVQLAYWELLDHVRGEAERRGIEHDGWQ